MDDFATLCGWCLGLEFVVERSRIQRNRMGGRFSRAPSIRSNGSSCFVLCFKGSTLSETNLALSAIIVECCGLCFPRPCEARCVTSFECSGRTSRGSGILVGPALNDQCRRSRKPYFRRVGRDRLSIFLLLLVRCSWMLPEPKR